MSEQPKPFDRRVYGKCEHCEGDTWQTFCPGIYMWGPEFPRHEPKECIANLHARIKQLEQLLRDSAPEVFG